MEATKERVTTEEESRRVAEESRETEWAGRGFLRELFLGNLELDLVHQVLPDVDGRRAWP